MNNLQFCNTSHSRMLWYLCRKLVGISITFLQVTQGHGRSVLDPGTVSEPPGSPLHFLLVKERLEEKEMKKLLVAVTSREKLEWYCLFL